MRQTFRLRCSGTLIVAVAAMAMVIFDELAFAQTSTVPQSQQQVRLSFAPLVEQVAPAVVNIYTRKVVESSGPISPLFNDPFFKRFFGEGFGGSKPRSENSLGSGVIVSEDGLIVTNHHVIDEADDIQVILRDRREFAATVILSDERTDIAVLKLIDPQGALPVATFGDSDSVQVGDLALAIGNPFGVGQTVTSGIVSGLARTSVDISDYQSFIQTDAAINPGNSGGALVAMDGSVIGINTAIFSGSGGSHGIGFAVPSNMVSAVLRSAVSGTPLVRPWLGFEGRLVDWDIAGALGMAAPHGVIVEQVHPDGPAAEAGLQAGDIILRVDSNTIEDPQNLRFRAATKSVGDTITLSVIRDGDDYDLHLILIAPPEVPPRAPITINRNAPIAGTVLVNLSPALTEELGVNRGRSGVMVFRIARGSPAARLGLRPGDILRRVNDIEINLTEDVGNLMNQPPKNWHLEIDRDGERLSVNVR